MGKGLLKETGMYYSPSQNTCFPAEFRADYERAGSWPEDAVEIPLELYHAVVSNRPGDKDMVPGPDGLPMLVSRAGLTLDDVKAAAKSDIDAAAGEARGRYITVAAGQEATYVLKAQRAAEFKAAGYTGTVPPMVKAEADATGETPQQAADRILAEQYAWELIGADIERVRRSGKIKVETASDASEAIAARDDTLTALEAI